MARLLPCFAQFGLLLTLAATPLPTQAQSAPTQGVSAAQAAPSTAAGAAILSHADAAARMPATVFYRGQTAPIQSRNAAGLQLPGGRYLLAAVVDTSGYASAVAQSYQAYLLTELPVHFGGRDLPAGAYGFGFVGTDFVCMDLGGAEVLRIPATHDAQMPRPVPLQIVTGSGEPGTFRLYAGRNYVSFHM